MKRSFFFIAFTLVAVAALAQVNPKPFTIPEVREWKGGKGTITLVDRMNDEHITFAIKPSRKAFAESYSISITPREVKVIASDSVGLFWGRQTLRQLMEQSKTGSIPCGTIHDYPAYPLRGFMLDCGRKFIPVHTLEAIIRTLSYYKLNTLHLHLNDNAFKAYFNDDWTSTPAAFRLECETYPGLTATDGFYTKQQFIDLQRYAEEFHVNIIPEFDAPAHSLAFTHYDPSLGSEEFGMDHLNLRAPEKVYPFLDALWEEYLGGDEPVFRGPTVNIGTDEYSNRDSTVVEEFRRFTDHYIRLVESYGKKAALWGALTHARGVTPVKADGVQMNCWYNGYADPVAMKEAGYNLVSIPDGYVYIVPAAGYYYDYLNCQFLYEQWTPAVIGDAVFDEDDPAIDGGMFALWNDHPGNGISTHDIFHRFFPAAQTIGAKCWSASHATFSWDEFNDGRAHLGEGSGDDFDEAYMGINWPYTVSFDIVVDAADGPGTALFTDELRSNIFWLQDPISGQIGFSRDGYLYTFGTTLTPGSHNVKVEGTNAMTRLTVDGKVVKSLVRRWRFYGPEGKARMAEVPTFIFPTDCPGVCRSTVSPLTITHSVE